MSDLACTFEHVTADCICAGKQCTRCQNVRCIGNFHRHIRSKDGYRAACKSCRKAESKTEEFKAKRREHHKENAEQINESKREWYHSHPEQARQHSKTSRLRNPERVKAYQQEYARSERGKQRHHKYRSRHPEKVKQFTQAWKDNHPEIAQEHAKVRAANYKAKKLGVAGKITSRQWRELKTYYQDTCLRCKQREPAIALTIDHIVPFALRGINEISNVQPLCEFCNTSKGVKIVDYRLNYYKERDCG